MAKSEQFHLGFLSIDTKQEEMFISVTPVFEYGPGIQRDGITTPRMTDPHGVARIRNAFCLQVGNPLSATTDPYLQRAGTWTIYHHMKKFIEEEGKNWEIVGVQSNGDLTMNFWHTAYIRKSYIENQGEKFCALQTSDDPPEPIKSRIYHSLIKWGDRAMKIRGRRYECLNLKIEEGGNNLPVLRISDSSIRDQFNSNFTGVEGYNENTRDIAPLVKFTLRDWA